MKLLFLLGLLMVIVGLASFFIGLPAPYQVSAHTLSVTVRVVVFLAGMGFIVAGVAWE
jgi:hypothetical protein